MKAKLKNEIREMDPEALKKKERELMDKITSLRYGKQISLPKNSREIKNLRIERAMVLTALKLKEQSHGI